MSPNFSISALNLKPVKNYVFLYALYIRWSDKCLLMSVFPSALLINFTHQAILVCGRSYTLSLANTAKACTQLVSYMWLDVRLYCCCHVQWPFSYCCPKKQESCCLKPYVTTDFIIHTIWTLNSKRQIQMDCNGPLFDEHKVHFANVFPLPSQCRLEAGLIITLIPCMSVVWEIRLPLESFPCVLLIQVQFVRGFHSFPYKECQKSFLWIPSTDHPDDAN
jgi:hypothetical protein